MTDADEIGRAADEARKVSACPIGYVGGRISGHWSVDEICSWFACAECEAAPRDFGYDMDEWPDPDDLPEESPYMRWLTDCGGAGCFEVPF